MNSLKNNCSLCISTYNWPGALRQCLKSIKSQSVLPSEVIIGDDGSSDETKQLIETTRKDFPVPLIHLWHEDKGFRLATTRNKTFAKAKGDYIIQSDGDVIFHRNFIRDHLLFAKKNTFIAGTRCLLNNNISTELISGQRIAGVIELLRQSSKKYNGVRCLPAALLNYSLQKGIKQTKYVLGANMAFWKEDIIKVNGYNEQFTGWGKEDNDLAARLHIEGVSIRFLKYAAILFHLYHQQANRDNFETNDLIYRQTIIDKNTFSPKGIDQYL